jgi:ribosome-associated protein
MTSLEKAHLISKIALEKKGENIILIDTRDATTLCDWFLVISAGSDRRIKTIARSIDKDLSLKKIPVLHVEGKQNSLWVLMDYGDVVVHIFYKDIREFYELERLWSDSPQEHIDEQCLKKTSKRKSQSSSKKR